MELASFVETKVTSIALMTPSQILDHLAHEGEGGWELRALGSTLAFLQREVGGDPVAPDYSVESITLSLPFQIARTLKARGAEGWSLAGVGASFLFLRRDRNRPAVPLDFELDSVTLRSLGGVQKIVARRAEQGWALCGTGPNFAFFEKPLQAAGATAWDPKSLEVAMHSITLKAPGQISNLLNQQGEQGWWLCAAGSSFVFLRRRKE